MTHIGRRDTLHAISGWLYELANLTAGSAPLADAKAKVASLATSLADVFPAEAFSRPSLLAIARECKFFPSYAELCNHLGAWWRDNRPAPLLLGDAPGLDDNARMWLAYFHKREAEGFRNGDGKPPSSRAHVLSLVKQQSPAAWARITGESSAPKPPPTDEEKAAVRQIVANMRFPTIPESHTRADQIAAVTQAARQSTTRPPGTVAPGVLAAARAAAGIVAVAPNLNPKPPPIPEPEDEFLDAPFPDEDDLPEGDPLPEDHEFAPRQEEWA